MKDVMKIKIDAVDQDYMVKN